MLCMGIWGHHYIHTLLCKSEVNFGVLGVDLSLYDVVMSLLRLQQASDWTPHPYWIYTKPFGTLICCVCANGATPTVMHLCRSGVDFGVLGVDLSLYECWNVIVEATTGFRLDPTYIHIGCIQSILSP